MRCKIICVLCWQVLGLPTEEVWTGVSHLPLYEDLLKKNMRQFRAYQRKPTEFRKLGRHFPKLYDIPEGENMASALLQVGILTRINMKGTPKVFHVFTPYDATNQYFRLAYGM